MTKQPKSAGGITPSKTVKQKPISFSHKFIQSQASPRLSREPISLPLRSRSAMLMRWSQDKRDIQGRWSWGQSRFWGSTAWRTKLRPFLRDAAKKTWAEIEIEKAGKDKRHKTYPLEAIIKEAQDRLVFLELNDLDEIFRFRLASKDRLYGFLVQHMFFVLWWDPSHQICPSDIQERGKQRRK